MEGVRGRRVRMRGGREVGEEGGRGRGRLGPEEAIEPKQRKRIQMERLYSIVFLVFLVFLQSYCNIFFLHMRKIFCSDCSC